MATKRTIAMSLTAAATLGLGSAAQGDILVHEGFDYAPGVYNLTNDSLGGGVGFGSNVWFGHVPDLEFRVTDGGANGAYLDGVGGMNSPTSLWRSRNFQSAGDVADGGVIWSSVSLSSGGTTQAQINFEAPSGHQHAILRLEEAGTYTLLGAHFGDGDSDASTIAASTDLLSPDRIVLRFENLANNEMLVNAWVNPTAASEATLGAADMTVTFVADSSRNLGAFTVAPGSARIDDLIVAESYGDFAIPEPASLALMGAGSVLMLRRRR